MAEADKGNQIKEIKPIDEVRLTLLKMEPQFKMVLPPQVSVEKFTRVLLTAIQLKPELLQANRQSLYAEAMKCATDGLIPDGREATLNVYKGLVKYLPMVGGILKKIRNSGELATITAQVVYTNDVFEYELGDNERVLHKPKFDGDRGEAYLVYAIAKTKDGGIYREIMTKDEVMDVKKMSPAGDKGPWGGPFSLEMWRKTVIRRLSKRLPMSTDIEQVLHRDDDIYDLNRAGGAPAKGGEKKSRLGQVIDATTTDAPQPVAEVTQPVVEGPTTTDAPI